jgi:glutaredoxin
MARSPAAALIAFGLLAAMAGAAFGQGQTVYRYTDADGRIVYSDHPPPNARDVEAKQLTPNYIEIDQTTLASQKAQQLFPVTLYTFACGEVCDRAEALLNRRGVPFTTVNVADSNGAEKLKKLTGDVQAPVLQVGDKLLVKGYGEAQWQALLDTAGYPKSPPSRRTVPAAEAPKPGADAAKPAAAAKPAKPGGYPQD